MKNKKIKVSVVGIKDSGVPQRVNIEEDLYFDSTDMYDNLYTEEQVRSDYILIDKVAYVHPYIEIYFVFIFSSYTF